MATWARRMHRRAATIGSVVTSCGHPVPPYPRRIEKVKFGISLDQVCKNDIPGPLLVMILKLNKEAPYKKDIFRAPGHQGNMKKLIHFLQTGRLVNIDNFSVYTIASVLKKFLRKLPGGIFGPEFEERLFQIIELESTEDQRDEIHSLITSMPVFTQHLLVLLFGTFRVIATNAERAQTGMTSEALGVSVAPSFFQSCVSDGKQAKMEDVVRFKVATKIMKFLIDNFGVTNLFGRENYEYYARITGRVLKVEEEWIFSFRYPPDSMVPQLASQEESQSTPALLHIPEEGMSDFRQDGTNTSLTMIPEATLHESCTRLSISLEENGLFQRSSSASSSSSTSSGSGVQELTLEELKAINWYAESTKSLSFLPQVHERQTARMRTRSEWFLSSAAPALTSSALMVVPIEYEESAPNVLRGDANCTQKSGVITQSTSDDMERSKMLLRRISSKEKRHLSRTSSKSKRNKENGNKVYSNKAYSVEALHSGEHLKSPIRGSAPGGVAGIGELPSRTQSVRNITEQDCTELDVQTFHITLTYKPRI